MNFASFWRRPEGVTNLLDGIKTSDLVDGKDISEVSNVVLPKLEALLSEETTKQEMFKYIAIRFKDSLRGLYNSEDVYWGEDFIRTVFLPMLAPQLAHLYEGKEDVNTTIKCLSGDKEDEVARLQISIHSADTPTSKEGKVVPYAVDTYILDNTMNIVSGNRWYGYTDGAFNTAKSNEIFPISIQDGNVQPDSMYLHKGKKG